MADLSQSLQGMQGLNLNPGLWSGGNMPDTSLNMGTGGGGTSPMNFGPSFANTGLPLTSGLSSIAGGFLGQQQSQAGLQAAINQLMQSPQLYQQYMQQTQQNYQPFVSAGTQAAGALKTPQTSFQTSPGYQFGIEQAIQQMNQQAAARGNYFAPATTAAIGEKVQGMGLEEYNTWFQQMLQQSGLGLMGAGGISQAGQFSTSGLSGLQGALQQLQGQQAAGGSAGMSGLIQAIPSLATAAASFMF